MQPADVAVRFPNDGFMAPPAFVRQVRAWAMGAFGGDRVADRRLRLRVIRQDHSALRFGRSCIETPLRIGAKSFKRGLGTHAFSDISVEPPEGAERFEALIGVDNNADTGGRRGSVEFVVEVDGEEALRSPVLRGGAPPVPVVVRISPGARELRLKVTDGGDDAGYDQADWADARFVMRDGSERYLDEGQLDLPMADEELPVSFTLGGRPSRELLGVWTRTSEVHESAGFTRLTTTRQDPQTGMALIIETRIFKRYPAVEWVAHFENRGGSDSPILEDVRSLDLRVGSGYARIPLTLHHLNGDTCSVTSFQPLSTPIEPGKTLALAPTGGRPSSITAFPFWNLQYHDMGLITGIGWTGQWQAEFSRGPTGPGSVCAGMQGLRTLLHPGERIRTPRVLIMPWKGARADAHVRFRRLMFEHFTPTHQGKTLLPPMAIQTFDRYHSTDGWATESGQLAYARVGADLGFDTVWLDAAWFPGGFPNGVGSWAADVARFPRGLKPIADAAHERKMRFVLWFEPERVAAGSEIAREHPDWVFGGASGGLFKLNEPEARKWLTDLLIQRIGEYGVDIYRQDFNMDPLAHWRTADPPYRQGMTEIRYVEGLYEMWDAIRQVYPGILIDNCSSGGRRLDLEMMMRSIPLWRSDTGCSPGHPEWNQMQSLALAQYLPLFTVGLWSAAPYERRSAGTAGVSFEVPYLDSGYDPSPYAEAVRELTELRSLWIGDFHLVAGADTATDRLAAWQLHRPDLDRGAIYCFRRPECVPAGIVVPVKGVKPTVSYDVEFRGETGKATRVTMTGKEMAAGLVIRLPKPGSSVVVIYGRSRKAGGAAAGGLEK